ncbi:MULTISPECIES: winged helix-turn-helix domain-containing protein [Enterobacter]|uniref:winged helix-turn-helix domain-containing protein n=1 Tax=Enterobacter TaxID=547 RepID=UPI0005F0E67C|nr:MULTISPECIES: winged helix-turn-helix domain-containing protein [Enterobacter]EMC1014142.1 winged helix-turn-helix domain-containing protein [Enterobacter bugandensis]KJQ41561.1 transcriptional regulator [Enterobacter bugandensis]KLR25800.1 transcriptional regulator [Enterobacter bugandensis]MCE2006886.1 winged helix-turn-helix domain-containing protein [Enterobacter bugandensis]MDX7473427.1 winged helix-turn-helix domain-containing protein [Enterobacter bugandensis]
MLNNIAIGSLVSLDLQSRTLARTDTQETVTLPQSACLCLAALVEAHGEVLSQEQLMEIGWRSAGVEVTDNSVRVMITKLRRAFAQLNLQEAVTLIAVTRSGYRLLVRESGSEVAPATQIPDLPQQEAPEQAVAPEVPPTVEPAPPRARSTLMQKSCATLSGVLVGLVIALLLRGILDFSPQPVHFVRWNGPGVPPGTEVMVQQDKQSQTALIESTLQTYTRHVLARRTDEKPAAVLYVTTGSEKMSKFQGLIACQQPFKDSGNDCESFYFRHY